MSNSDSNEYINEIAIIGMAGRFPGAANVDAFWNNLCAGVESISVFTDAELTAAGVSPVLLRDPNFVKASAVMDGIEQFDASFFGFTPRDAEITDPQHRVFLESAWEALENAGYDPEAYPGTIGVYAGSGMSTYLINNLLTNRSMADSIGLEQIIIANDKDFLTTRVSYKLNLRGPSLSVQTACSTSLVAVHLACQSLLNGECDMALAGGASVQVPHHGYMYQEGGILSPDGHCRAFDAQAQGTVFGNAVALVVLKRLGDAIADGDRIYAVIKGSAINNDGAMKGGFTAPSVIGQAKVIAEALGVAQVEPSTISYIEAHGTGTALGDPIEIAALTKAFGADTKTHSCAIGSLKTNVGHLDRASGVTGLIKTALALRHELIPPSLHFSAPNPKINFADSPFYVNTSLAPWHTKGAPRRAGISSLGIGGTNAHVVLEEAPAVAASGESRPLQLLMLSAKTATALETAGTNLAQHLRAHPELPLADVAYTLQVGRRGFEQRRAIVCRDRDDAIAVLEHMHPERVLSGSQNHTERPVAFLFPGQGSQYIRMAAGLYQNEPSFRAAVDQCADLLQPHLEHDLRELLYPETQPDSAASNNGQPTTDNGPLDQTQYTQPALFVIEYALAKLWMAWGITPQIMIGHSIGEYVAACLAGVFSLEDALTLVAARGRLMQGLPSGAMLSVALGEELVRPLLRDQLAVAAINAPSLCVVSGPSDQIERLAHDLDNQGMDSRRLHTSHAFHSPMVDPILEQFELLVRAIQLNSPQLAYVSNVTGQLITPAEATDPAYWARHLRATVRFADGLAVVLNDPNRVLLEVGPGSTLGTLAQQNPAREREHVIVASLRPPRDQTADVAFLLGALGRLWLAGILPDWAGFYARERRLRVPLPTYPFERQRYWIDPPLENRHVNGGALPSSPIDQALAAAGLVEERELVVGQAASEDDGMQQLSLHDRPDLPNQYVAPRNEIEQTIVDVWQELLGIAPIGVYDNFFELGGHSLLATKVASRLRQLLPIDVPLRDMFEARTVADLTVALVQAMANEAEGGTVNDILAEIEQMDSDGQGDHARAKEQAVAAATPDLAVPPDPDRLSEAAITQQFDIDTAGLSLHEMIKHNMTDANPNGEIVKQRIGQFYNSISDHLSTSVFGEYATYLNYGYIADQSQQYATIDVPKTTLNRNSLKLIAEVIGSCDLAGRDILDISCGRGGPLAAIAHYFHPRRMIGGDLSAANITFCRRQHASTDIQFQIEDADHLSFPDDSFDVVINIEASHLYPNVYRFYAEVFRVLRSGGSFLYTDLFDATYAEHNLISLCDLGFVVELDRDITANVLLSCAEAAPRNLKAYTENQGSDRLNSFLAMPGSQPYQDLQARRLNYRILRLRKP